MSSTSNSDALIITKTDGIIQLEVNYYTERLTRRVGNVGGVLTAVEVIHNSLKSKLLSHAVVQNMRYVQTGLV